MKLKSLVVLSLAVISLAACNQPAMPLPQVGAVDAQGQPIPQQPVDDSMSPLTAGLLGAAAGAVGARMLGGGGNRQSIVHNTTVVQRNVTVVRPNTVRSYPRMSSFKVPSRYTSTTTTRSFSRSRR